MAKIEKLFKDCTFVIPCRKGSKGLPFKNRKLVEHTLEIIPSNLRHKTIISTDDEEIMEKYKNEYDIFHRSSAVSNDTASTKSLFLEMKSEIQTQNIIMLYVTYPDRKFEDVVNAMLFYLKNKASSLLCSKKLKVSPFLMMYDLGDFKGRQLVEHDLYRRQDYPKCFEISHYVSIFNKKELDSLNNNLYNDNTLFYPIDDVVDIDTVEDLEEYNAKH